jgi:hypothetical protein
MPKIQGNFACGVRRLEIGQDDLWMFHLATRALVERKRVKRGLVASAHWSFCRKSKHMVPAWRQSDVPTASTFTATRRFGIFGGGEPGAQLTSGGTVCTLGTCSYG